MILKRKSPKTTLTVRVSPEVKERLEEAAFADGRTPSNLVAYLLAQWAENQKRGMNTVEIGRNLTYASSIDDIK